MKTHFKNIALVFFTMAIFVGCQSYEKKMEKYAQRAVEYRKTLPQDVDIICEVIDSTATKIFYKEKDSECIVVYDLTTKSKSIIEDGELAYMYYFEYRTQLYKDRLFIIAETGACGGGLNHAKNVSYINVRDNSVHHVIECYEANFIQDGSISIERAFPMDDSRPTFELEWLYDEYVLSAYLSDEEYALSEIKQKGKEAEMAEQARKAKEQEIIQWIQGTWEWSGRMHLYGSQYADVSMRLVITGDNITAYGNGRIQDQGRIKDIDITNDRISFGEHSYLDFDEYNKTIYTGKREEKTCYKKISDSPYHYSSNSSSYSSSRSNNSQSSISTFHTSAEVLSYTGGKFRDRSGNVISIRQEGIYGNGGYPSGQLITNAVKVVRFDATSALLTTSSPYGGGGAMYIRVDASQGTITDGSGCVYYKQ